MLNHVALLGRLAQDPVLRQTPNGIAVANFDLAVNAPTNRENVPPDYIPIVCWRETAEFVSKYLKKGRQIVVEGKISTSKYTDKDGNNRKRIDVRASRIYFADSNYAGAGKVVEDKSAETADELSGYTPVDDSELPF